MSETSGVLDDLLAKAADSGPDTVLDGLDAAGIERLAGEISTPAQLRRLVEVAGEDPATLDRLVDRILTMAGNDVLLDRVFDLMPGRFVGARMPSETGVVEWRVTTPDDNQTIYHLSLAAGQAESARGPAKAPRTTLTLSAANLMRLCAGTLNGVAAFMNGDLKLAGDMMFGAKLPAAFDLETV